MLNRVLGKKIGMTQIFNEKGNVVPVTVVDVGSWFVTQIKTSDTDGYASLQLGLLKKRHRDKTFDNNWLKNKKNYFSKLREVKIDDLDDESKFKVAQKITLEHSNLKEGSIVDVRGISRGLGFQGVVKRWNFGGGPASHGSTFHRIPGSIGNICSCGRVDKGKKMPGHAGSKCLSIKNLKVIRLDKDKGYLFINGAIPGKKDSFVSIRMQG